MTDWTNHPDAEKVLGLAADPRPAWLWSSDGTKRLWRNDAAKLFGARLKASGVKRVDNPQPIKGQVARIIRLGLLGRASLSRMQFIAGRKPLSATCICTPMDLGEGKPLLLVVGVDPIDDAIFAAAGEASSASSEPERPEETTTQPEAQAEPQTRAEITPEPEPEASAHIEVEDIAKPAAPSGLAALVEKLASDGRLFAPLGEDDDTALPAESVSAPARDFTAIAFDETLEGDNHDSDWGEQDPLALEEAAFDADQRAEGEAVGSGLWQLTGRGLTVKASIPAPAEETAEAEAVERVSRYNFEELSRILTDRVGRLPDGEGPESEPQPGSEPRTKKPKGSLLALSDETLVLNRLPLGILIFRDQDILFVNRAMTDLTGHETTTTLRALGLSAIFPTTSGQDPAGPVSHLMQRDGEKIAVSARLQTITWQGRSAFMLSARASEDATTASPMAIVTREKSKESSPGDGLPVAALSRISRELRRPLNTIGGFSELIATEAFGPITNSRYIEYARDIKSASHAIADLADELDDYVRLAEGKVALSPADIALTDLLTECLVRVRKQAGAARVLLRSSLSERLPMIRADATTLSQAVLNMLASAIAATEQGGRVVLSAQREDDGAVNIHVRDDTKGPGAMADSFIVFRDGTDRDGDVRQPVRSSIGLTLTRSLVAVNACSLRLDPASESGTLMTLTIPAELVIDRQSGF